MFLVTNITLISIPGFPLLTLEVFLTLIFIILFFANGKRFQFAHGSFPYKKLFALLSICWVVSSIFAIAGFSAELSNLIKNISEEIVFVWLMWEVLETEEDFKILYKYITIVIFASCVYGLVEYLIQNNPLALYEATLNKDESKVILGLYSTEFRGYRIQSFFEHAIGAGINWGLYSVFTIWLWINKKVKIKFPFFYLFTAFMCIPSIILTKMRSTILFFLIACLSLVDIKKKRFYRMTVMALPAVFLLYPIIRNNLVIFMSIFNSAAQQKIGGSTFDMRIMQIIAAINLVKLSPFVGLGNKFANVLSRTEYVQLYGMESIWIWVIVQFGLVGVISYLVYALYSIVIIPLEYNSKPMMFFALAYWVTYTVTSVPGMKIYLYFLIMIFFIKNSEKYINGKQKVEVIQK